MNRLMVSKQGGSVHLEHLPNMRRRPLVTLANDLNHLSGVRRLRLYQIKFDQKTA